MRMKGASESAGFFPRPSSPNLAAAQKFVGACTYPFYMCLGQMNPKGLLMFIPLSPKGVYTPYKVGGKPRKPRGTNKGYVLPPSEKSLKQHGTYGTRLTQFLSGLAKKGPGTLYLPFKLSFATSLKLNSASEINPNLLSR